MYYQHVHVRVYVHVYIDVTIYVHVDVDVLVYLSTCNVSPCIANLLSTTQYLSIYMSMYMYIVSSTCHVCIFQPTLCIYLPNILNHIIIMIIIIIIIII